MLGSEKYFWWVAFVLLPVVYGLQYYGEGDSQAPQVPCYFIFGDSLADNGNNNFLKTLAKVDYSPYGIDFPQGPTGRFCNGRTIVDIIAEMLGFKNHISPFATANGLEILSGVNYASGSAGIRNETGTLMGECLSFDKQLQNHKKIVSRLVDMLGNKEGTMRYLNKCLYSVGFGNNDYLNNYFLYDYFPTSQEYDLDQYAQVLTQEYTQQLRTLYEYGARKIVLFGMGKIGCTPGAISLLGTKGSASGCAEMMNIAAQHFNSRLVSVVDQLNSDLTDAKFIYLNNYKIGEDSTVLGFKVNNTGCCASSSIGQCVEGQIPCEDRTEYMFWDSYHPTETFNIFYAERSYRALEPYDAYPFDIRHLVLLNQRLQCEVNNQDE